MANYTNHKNNKRLSDETIAEIRRRVATGEKKLHVATDMKLSHAVISKYTEPTVSIRDKKKQRAINLLDQGYSRSAVAKELKLSRLFVGQLRPGSGPSRIKPEV
jgi:DNA-binding NarL/FixJ family response regulator